VLVIVQHLLRWIACGEDGFVPETPAAARMRATRERARRREMVDVLRVAEAVAAYARRQVGNGLAPAEARLAAVEVASELAEVAAALRRLARLSASERRLLVHRLTGLGLSRVQVARRLGCSERTVYRCLGPGPGNSTAGDS
jgi:DNA-binding NarL/FixJ family response regulator